ncbi:MAG TPA: NTP transferase domain-containing protein [Gemmatimonadota bacterium]|nr:NTP transferase domain-containing protein [Gemmatimonadota bacterium]
MAADGSPLAAVILAAGQGKRMRSALIKILHPLAGRQMIRHVIEAVRGVGADRIVCVVGFQQDRVRDALTAVQGVAFAVQEEQLGTGHALQCAAPALNGFAGDVLVCCGDTPLLTDSTLRSVVAHHRAHGSPATLLTTRLEDPAGYGRVVTDAGGRVERVVEEADADAGTRAVQVINTGVYCFAWPLVQTFLEVLAPGNVQGERYLTDVMAILAERGTPGRASPLDDPLEVMGINDRTQLAEAEGVLRGRIRRRLMLEGVTFLAPETTLIDADVEIGSDTVVYPGVLVEGASTVGPESVIGPFTRIVDAHIGRGVELKGWNYIAHTTVPNGSIVGPYVQQGAE